MKIKHTEKYIVLLSFVVLIVLFILLNDSFTRLSSVASSNQIFSLKTKNGKKVPEGFIYSSNNN